VLQLRQRNEASLALRGHHLVPQSSKGVEHRLGPVWVSLKPSFDAITRSIGRETVVRVSSLKLRVNGSLRSASDPKA
jgi:hypothetical protein